jgi:hypothetical protein
MAGWVAQLPGPRDVHGPALGPTTWTDAHIPTHTAHQRGNSGYQSTARMSGRGQDRKRALAVAAVSTTA